MADNSGNSNMLSRKVWRKLVKKLRRKRIRQKRAIELKEEIEASPEHQINLVKARLLEEHQLDEEEKERQIRHEQWLRDEEELCKIWREQQETLLKRERDKEAIQKRIRDEWETAKRKKEEREKEEERKREAAKAKIDDYILHGGEIPEELRVLTETNPNKELCPFFSKVAACRFGFSCSRNHVLPAISKILLIPGFYSHFNLYPNRSTEYDTDVGLEFEETDMFKDFRGFFDDVISELQQWTGLRVVQVCRNSESHLRGNLYAEYKSERSALAAARGLNARWYGGRQLTVQFVNIPDWGSAICGDFKRGRCPKGADCNFLHVFRNPRGELQPILFRESVNSNKRSSREWRWSESPEPERRSVGSSSRKSHRSERSSKSSRRSRERDFENRKSHRRSRSDRYSSRRSRSKSSTTSQESIQSKSRSPLSNNVNN